MKKLSLLAAGFVGYVLGSRAGRERYEQIKGMATKVRNDPRVQEKAKQATEVVKEKAPVVSEKVTDVAGAAVSKVKGGSSDPDPELLDQLNPDSTAHQENSGPRGDLP